jgi:preprotein translocase subunit SecD
MIIRRARFNFILLVAALAAFVGCQTTPEDKVTAVLRIHLEVNPDAPQLSNVVPIFRSNPVLVNVQRLPFLTEAHIEKADVVNTVGGFAIQLVFNHIGAQLLEQYSATNPSRRFAIYCQFGAENQTTRWLAAPMINRPITDGELIFTPDCSRAEAEQFVLGLNNVSGETKRRSKK